MPGGRYPITLTDDQSAQWKALHRTSKGGAAAQKALPAKDFFTVSGPSDTTHQLTAIPYKSDYGSSVILTLNGLALVGGNDYTVDYTTGVVTVSETLVAGDELYAEYWTTGELVAATLPADGDTWGTVLDWQSAGYKYLGPVVADSNSGFEATGYDDSGWSTGQAGFGYAGADVSTAAVINTTIDTTGDHDFLVRRTVSTVAGNAVRISFRVDDSVAVYWNGSLVVDNNGDHGPWYANLPSQQIINGSAALGSDLLAIRLRDRSGAVAGGGTDVDNLAYLDVRVEQVVP